MRVNIDAIVNGKAYGDTASFVTNTGVLDVGTMRPWIGDDGRPYVTVYTGGDPEDPKSYQAVQANQGLLRRDEWKEIDKAVMKAAESRLVGIQDLISRGLTYNLTNALGTPVLGWDAMTGNLQARISMDGVTRAENDRVVFQRNYLPIPIIHVDYEINSRFLEVSRRMGNPIDTTQAERASRAVAEALESMLFTDTTYSWGEKDDRGRNTIYSYLNYPDINTLTFSNATWTNSATTPKDILKDVLAMKQKSIDAKHYGPWVLYIPTAYETKLDDDYDSTTPGTTIKERILKITGIEDVKVVDMLPADHVLLVEMQSDTVRLIRGLPIQSVQWQTEGKFVNKFKVWTIQVPQIRSDANGNCGIVLLS